MRGGDKILKVAALTVGLLALLIGRADGFSWSLSVPDFTAVRAMGIAAYRF
jgi:hypothetical protein